MPTRPIRALPATSAPADVQIAAGLAMLDGLERGGPALRWSTLDRPAALLGMSQRRALLDEAACAAAGVAIHRRQSGGGLVLADATLLLLDLALPHGDPLASADLTQSYRWLGEAAADALRALGTAPHLVEIAEARADTAALAPPLSAICYAGRSPFEVLAAERKLVGLAQVRRRHGALFQLGIYLRWQPRRTADLLALPADQRADVAAALARRVVGMDEAAPGVTADQLRGAVEQAIGERGLCAAPDDWRPDELAALAAARPRYAALPPQEP